MTAAKHDLRLFLFFFGLVYSNIFSQNSGPIGPEQKFQIQIEDEMEEGVTSSSDKKEGQEIIVSGQDEQLIRTQKSDTTFISPTDASSIRWIDDKSQLDKDGKSHQKSSEKSGDIVPAYGSYNNFLLNLNIVKSDKFGLYQLKYLHDNSIAEGFNGKELSNSEKSLDSLKIALGQRILPFYTIYFEANYEGDTIGFQKNPDYSGLLRRWGGFNIQNQFKQGNQQVLNIDLTGNYLQSKFKAQALPESNPLYLNGSGNLQWMYIFNNKISIEATAGYDYLFLKDINLSENQASTVNSELFFSFPLTRTFLGPSKNIPWQLDLKIGGGGFYKDGVKIQPVATAWLDSKFSFWNSRIQVEKAIQNFVTDSSRLHDYYESPVYYQLPQSYWNYFWENAFTFNKESSLKIRTGYKQFVVYYNPQIGSNFLYTNSPATYNEMYARLMWEYSFIRSLLLETALDINYSPIRMNMIPVYSFLVVLNYDTERLDAAISVRAVGQRNLNSISLPDYFLVGANVKYWISPSFAIMASVENLLNQNYIQFYPYPESGIKIFAGCYIKL
ncbi:MAG: hypothetical protein OEV66_08980 [Spirochaetia bacterium]|nr:hypothetical protein [Spirochaetia bacterium]